ncbi:helix-turn-helix domain-containing protein [Frateuria sp. GZRe12]|uniref:helix-turn-helix domain-containing protein n=1 Tax=Frateuria sp. GZRe12 TaxID=3351533 RepID=UPI003EDB9FDF
MGESEASRVAIAQRLRESREYVGLSQDEVASALGLSRPAVTNIENGSRKVEATELHHLARLYRRTVDYLLTGMRTPAAEPAQLAFLARAVRGLSERDLGEVARFAEFLKHGKRSD